MEATIYRFSISGSKPSAVCIVWSQSRVFSRASMGHCSNKSLGPKQCETGVAGICLLPDDSGLLGVVVAFEIAQRHVPRLPSRFIIL